MFSWQIGCCCGEECGQIVLLAHSEPIFGELVRWDHPTATGYSTFSLAYTGKWVVDSPGIIFESDIVESAANRFTLDDGGMLASCHCNPSAKRYEFQRIRLENEPPERAFFYSWFTFGFHSIEYFPSGPNPVTGWLSTLTELLPAASQTISEIKAVYTENRPWELINGYYRPAGNPLVIGGGFGSSSSGGANIGGYFDTETDETIRGWLEALVLGQATRRFIWVPINCTNRSELCKWAVPTDAGWLTCTSCKVNQCWSPTLPPSTDQVAHHMRYPVDSLGQPITDAGYVEVRNAYCAPGKCSKFLVPSYKKDEELTTKGTKKEGIFILLPFVARPSGSNNKIPFVKISCRFSCLSW